MNEKERQERINIVREYWEQQAEEFKTDPRSTIKDHQFRLLEIDFIRNLLNPADIVLDIGCGNGFQTLYYAEKVKHITGIDYAENMIKAANLAKENNPLKNKIEFKVDDVLNLNHSENSADTIVCERLLINLPTYEDQEKAVLNMHKCLKPNGRLLLSEVTQKGHDKINELRNLFGLENIKVHWHNLYIDEERFIPFLSKYFNILSIERFGMYQFISKVIHPLLVQPEEPKFEAKINEIARLIGSKITNFKDASHQVTFILEKK
ncbi:methyltransferase domain-containing protein [Candidatus Woesearchaeota archaeon]|nr:methyltransferase domain-containing protein [Candidatus Woesearchaeota archaeon]